MINLITAIGNQYLNERIKNIENFNIILKDIQYSEGILEILNINKDIDILLLSTSIFFGDDFKNFIENIKEKYKDLEIIIFIGDKYNIDIAFLNSIGIYKIYKNNKLGYEDYLNTLKNYKTNINEQIKIDMKKFKKEIFEKKNINIKEKEKNIFEDFDKTIMVSGTNGIGKSLFISLFSKYLESINKSVLIIDACFENSTINTIFGKSIKETLQKFSKRISYINYRKNNLKNDYVVLNSIIKEVKDNYECILIDTFSENINFNKKITQISQKIILLTEPNLLELKKAKKLLEMYKYDFEIPDDKIKIIFNKVNKFQISKEILKEVFEQYEILEYIKYNPKYTLYINKNMKDFIENEIFEKIYMKIGN